MGYGADPALPDLSEKQFSRLQRFEHLLGKVKEYEPLAQAGRPAHFGYTNDEGQVVQTVFALDAAQLHRMRAMAFHMYEEELSKHPATRDIARDILEQQKDHQGQCMTSYQLSKLWERD